MSELIVPDYLKEPSLDGHCYGTLEYDTSDRMFQLVGEPILLEFAKRVFPGAKVHHRDKMLEFSSSRREVADLNWLLMRYPVNIDQCRWVLESSRDEEIKRINKRITGDDLLKTTPPSNFLGKLYPYQESGVTYMAGNKRCLLADGMGLGKTWTGLAAAATAGKYPILVVCQTHVQEQWQRMIGMLFEMKGLTWQDDMLISDFERWERRGRALAPVLKSQTATAIPSTPFAIIHYGLLQWWEEEILEREFKTIIFDEIQELRHIGTQKYSSASLVSSRAENVFGMSGTPVFGYGVEIWSVMNAIDFHCLGSREAFTREWCSGYGEDIVTDPQALHGHLTREGLMLRRRATDDDVALNLPRVDRHVQDLNHDSELYDSLIKVALIKADGYHEASFTAKGRLARDIERESRKATGVAKAEYVAAFVRGLLEAGEKPLVYAWHHAVHDILREELKDFKPVFFTGKETVKKKKKGLKSFMEGETDIAILSLRSAAGLDGLQHRATVCVFAELDWSPAVFAQCETRIARIGVNETVENVPSYYCVSNIGHDEVMLDVLGVKTGQFVGIMGDEPDTQKEQHEAEKRAQKRIEQLVKKLQKEKRGKLASVSGVLE